MFVNERADSFLRAFSEDTVHVHLKDYKRLNSPEDGAHSTVFGYYLGYRDVGEGDADLRSVAGLLKSTGYRGMLSLELERVGDEEALLATLLKTYNIFA
jgi:sugar phosphate isomerase/epimerase